MLKHLSLLFAGAVLLLMTPLASSAQEWNAEQQSLIDHVTVCWDAWVDALADETPAQFYDACPQDERGHWWFTAHGAPGALVVDVTRNWHTWRETSEDWVSLRPVYVDIFGDVGIIHLYSYWRTKTPDGTVTTEMKRTEVFQRRGGQWVLIAGQITPVTPADAAPYRR